MPITAHMTKTDALTSELRFSADVSLEAGDSLYIEDGAVFRLDDAGERVLVGVVLFVNYANTHK